MRSSNLHRLIWTKSNMIRLLGCPSGATSGFLHCTNMQASKPIEKGVPAKLMFNLDHGMGAISPVAICNTQQSCF